MELTAAHLRYLLAIYEVSQTHLDICSRCCQTFAALQHAAPHYGAHERFRLCGVHPRQQLAVIQQQLLPGLHAVHQRGRAGDCKILGGGMDGEEDFETALSREVLEEGGLILCPGSMQLLGEIEEKRRDLFETDKIYHCHTYFFACTVEERTTEPHMTESEKAKGYHLEWMTPEEIVKANEPFSKEPWIYRDTAFVKMMMEGNL